jgi:hypothetical protein
MESGEEIQMKKTFWLFPAIAVATLLMAGEPAQPAKEKEVRRLTPEEIRARYTPDKLEQLRASLAARIAVIDQTEQGRRTPTPEESAALAPAESSAASPAVRMVTGGGKALHAAQASLEYLVATVDNEGAVKTAHQTSAAAKDQEGNRNEKR